MNQDGRLELLKPLKEILHREENFMKVFQMN